MSSDSDHLARLSGAILAAGWALFLVLGIELLYMAVTIFLEIPIHRSHDTRGYDLALFDRLIAIDIWLRKLPRLAQAPAVIYLLWRTVLR